MTSVGAKCPVCGVIIPTFDVIATAKGLLRKHVEVTVIGDATDWVAHLWMHREQAWLK